MSTMMPPKDPFAQLLCDMAASVEISKQLESELDQLKQGASCGSEHEAMVTHRDFHLVAAHSKIAAL
jgi:hypothetical protein